MNYRVLKNLAVAWGLSLALGLPAIAETNRWECTGMFARLLAYKPIPLSESLVKIGSPTRDALPADKLKLLLWNVHKHTHENWAHDFAEMGDKADIYLLQEVASSSPQNPTLAASRGKEWNIANSYETKDFTTGVATGSTARALQARPARSPVYEPILRTPKASLVSHYAIEGRNDSLLVVNVHAINFTRLWKFRAQINSLLPLLDNHRGPIVVAGDLNTWSPGRIKYLQEVLAKHGMTEAKPRVAPGFLHLDRVFTRGMKRKYGEPLHHVNSSDHKPLYFEFEYEN